MKREERRGSVTSGFLQCTARKRVGIVAIMRRISGARWDAREGSVMIDSTLCSSAAKKLADSASTTNSSYRTPAEIVDLE